MTSGELLTAIARITDLKRETVKDLLKKGWTYAEYDDVPRFTAPEKKV